MKLSDYAKSMIYFLISIFIGASMMVWGIWQLDEIFSKLGGG